MSRKRIYEIVVYFFVYRALDDDFIVNKRGDGPALQSKVCFEVVDKFPFHSFSGARENARIFLFSGCFAVPEFPVDNETSRLGNFSFDLFDRKGPLFIGNTIEHSHVSIFESSCQKELHY